MTNRRSSLIATPGAPGDRPGAAEGPGPATLGFWMGLALGETLLAARYWLMVGGGFLNGLVRRPAFALACLGVAASAATAARAYVFPAGIEVTATLERAKAALEESRLAHARLPNSLRDVMWDPPYRYAKTSEGYKLTAPGPDGRFGTRDDIVEHVTVPIDYRK